MFFFYKNDIIFSGDKMNIIKKYKHILALEVVILVIASIIIKKPMQFGNIFNDINNKILDTSYDITNLSIKKLKISYYKDNKKETKIIDENSEVLSKIEFSLFKMIVRKVDAPFFNKPYLKAIDIELVTEDDMTYYIDFISDKKFKLTYNDNGKAKYKFYKIYRNFDMDIFLDRCRIDI